MLADNSDELEMYSCWPNLFKPKGWNSIKRTAAARHLHGMMWAIMKCY